MQEISTSKVSGLFLAICFSIFGGNFAYASDGLPFGSSAIIDPHTGGSTGLSVMDITPKLRLFLGAPKDKGILVVDIASKSQASKIGLQVGDVIVSLGNHSFTGSGDLFRALWEIQHVSDLRMNIIRGKKEFQIEIAGLLGNLREGAVGGPRVNFFSWEQRLKGHGSNKKHRPEKSEPESDSRKTEDFVPSAKDWQELIKRFERLEKRLRLLEGEAI